MASVINWEEQWQSMLLNTHRGRLCNVSYWDKEASDFNENTLHMDNLTQSQLSKLRLLPEHTVLEVGAGTGRITIPVAKKVKQVTALEPSQNMLAILKANAEKEGVSNIRYVNKALEKLEEDDGVGPHDVAVASFSLFVAEIKKALITINALATKQVYLFLSASKGMEDELQKVIYGKTTQMLPDYLYIYNILHDIGILANVEIFDHDSKRSFNSVDAAVSKFAEIYHVPPEKKGALRAYMRRILVEDKGKFWINRKRKAAVIWWTKTK